VPDSISILTTQDDAHKRDRNKKDAEDERLDPRRIQRDQQPLLLTPRQNQYLKHEAEEEDLPSSSPIEGNFAIQTSEEVCVIQLTCWGSKWPLARVLVNVAGIVWLLFSTHLSSTTLLTTGISGDT
jgi:hypothetical protein